MKHLESSLSHIQVAVVHQLSHTNAGVSLNQSSSGDATLVQGWFSAWWRTCGTQVPPSACPQTWACPAPACQSSSSHSRHSVIITSTDTKGKSQKQTNQSVRSNISRLEHDGCLSHTHLGCEKESRCKGQVVLLCLQRGCVKVLGNDVDVQRMQRRDGMVANLEHRRARHSLRNTRSCKCKHAMQQHLALVVTKLTATRCADLPNSAAFLCRAFRTGSCALVSVIGVARAN